MYLKQLWSLCNTGKQHFKDISIVYPIMYVFYFLTRNYILSLKITIAFSCALLGLASYLLVFRITKKTATGLLIALLLFTNSTIFYIATQFPKTILAAAIFFFFVYFNHKKWLLPALLTLVLCFLSHRLMGFVALIYCLIDVFLKQTIRTKKNIFIAAIGLFLSLLIPGMFHIYDLERFAGSFSLSLQLPPLAVANLLNISQASLLWTMEIYLFYFLLILAILWMTISSYKKQFNVDQAVKLILFIAILFLIPIYKISADSVGFRLFLVAQVFIPFTLIPVISKINKKTQLFLICISLLFVLLNLVCFPLKKYEPPYKYYEVLNKKIISIINTYNPTMIIAHRPLSDYISFTDNIDTLPWYVTAPDENVWRITYDIPGFSFERHLSQEDYLQIHKLDFHYQILPEAIYRKYKASVLEEKDPALLDNISNNLFNPGKPLPLFLQRLSPK